MVKILISQKAPSNMAPYEPLQKKFGAKFDFCPFFVIEPLSAKEFRPQKINLPDYTAVVFSSRHTIDAYFKLADEMRFKVPETMKYFCTTELVAMYLQKHIVYRKRKIFFGDGKPESIANLVGEKHKSERFLICTSDKANAASIANLFNEAGLDCSVAEVVKSVSQDLKSISINSYDMVVLYNPSDLKSLYENYPDFQQGELKFVAYGKGIAKSLQEAGLRIDVQGPTPDAPSAAKAIELFLSKK